MKFKIGDRVKAIKPQSSNSKIIGVTGKIRNIFTDYDTIFYAIEFDKHIGGHEGDGHIEGGGKLGYCWNCLEDVLVKVNDEILKLRNRVLGIKEEVRK